MINNNNTTQHLNIEYRAPRPVNIDDIFYSIITIESNNFSAPCKICDGSGVINIKNENFECPSCHNHRAGILETIHNYIVVKYKVNSITIKSDIDAYSNNTKLDNITVTIKAFAKVKRGKYTAYETKIIETYPHEICYDIIDKNIDIDSSMIWLNKVTNITCKYNRNVLFSDYKTAVKIADFMNERELQKLKNFNAKHNTNYETNFETTHTKPATKIKK